jgi:hypothetical protein
MFPVSQGGDRFRTKRSGGLDKNAQSHESENERMMVGLTTTKVSQIHVIWSRPGIVDDDDDDDEDDEESERDTSVVSVEKKITEAAP